MSDPLATLRAAVESAAGQIGSAKARPTLERPKQAGFGDYSTNAAMLLAPVAGAPPREVAERLGEFLREALGSRLERVEVAGPGFLNLVLSDEWFAEALAHVAEVGDAFGSGRPERPQRVLIEFVSANPTGPLTAASGRHAAYGDSVARLLELAGHDVEREYYVNDAGSQVRNLGASIRARARGEEPPEDGYQGDYVRGLAEAIPGAGEADVDELAQRGIALMLEQARTTLAAYRVRFDSWFEERTLYEGDPSSVQRALAQLEQAGHLYRSEGALWLRTSALGDDKDRVVERSTGEPTYFTSDIGYHADKLARGYDRLIDVLGSDHHGYVARMRAALAALGAEPDRLDISILQFVHVVEHGERAAMSKRRGDFVTLDELIAEIGVDATRWHMVQRSHDSAMDLDLDLAREQSAENPVYYVQYAHARIVSVLAKADEEHAAGAVAAAPGEAVGLQDAERTLVKKLLAFPAEVTEAADRLAPHRMTAYVLELAQDFTAFYRDCRVVGAESPELEAFRIGLCVATKRTIARALDLLGVAAPESM